MSHKNDHPHFGRKFESHSIAKYMNGTTARKNTIVANATGNNVDIANLNHQISPNTLKYPKNSLP